MLSPNVSTQPVSQSAGRFTESQVAAEQAAFMRKVFAFMSGGLAVTGVTALVVAHSPSVLELIFGSGIGFPIILVAQLAMVLLFNRAMRRLSGVGAATYFYVYAIMMGLTMSVVFLRYTQGSIASTFFITAGTFGGLAAYGYVTKRDLTSVGSFMLMGLWGLILASVVNMFVRSPMLYWGISYFGVLIFVGLTAYDVQKIKMLNVIGNAGSDEDHKEAIHGALMLYLDFLNLFLSLLRILGRRR